MVLRRARFLVVASRWYEVFPVVLLEAFRFGVPAIVPRLGALPEIVGDGRRGVTYSFGDPSGLRGALDLALAMRDDEWQSLSTAAREAVDTEYSAEENLSSLLSIYATVRQQGAR